MKYTIENSSIKTLKTQAFIAFISAEKKLGKLAKELDTASKGYIKDILKTGDIDGSLGQTLVLHNVPGVSAKRVILVGIGKADNLCASSYQKIIQTIYTTLSKTNTSDGSFSLSELKVESFDLDWKIKVAIRSVAEQEYEFDDFKSVKTEKKTLSQFKFITDKKDSAKVKNAITVAEGIVKGIEFTKNISNTPPNVCTPPYLAAAAKKLGSKYKNIKTKILKEKEIKKLGMGAFHAVSLGSPYEPHLIIMEYNGGKKTDKPIVFVGKGVTFDTGGSSLKPPTGMIGMKYDMCGAASVLGVMQAAAELKLPINIVVAIPTCENIAGGNACKPDDIVTTMSGQTVEILNTDAEGRLILCDALTYVERYNPKAVIDVATLTGAIVIALGPHATGLFSNDSSLAKDLQNAGDQISDRAWGLPLWKEYANDLKSPFADMKNVGGREAASIVAASFLSKFTTKYNWAHLDIAGTAGTFSSGSKRGSTGRSVSLMVQYLLNQCNK